MKHKQASIFLILMCIMTMKLLCSSDGHVTSSKQHEYVCEELLNQYGLLDSPQQAYVKHSLKLESKKSVSIVKSQQEFAQAETAQQARDIFQTPFIQKRSSNLTIMQYAVFAECPATALLLLSDGENIEKIDKDRLLVQLKMLNQKKAVLKPLHLSPSAQRSFPRKYFLASRTPSLSTSGDDSFKS